MRIYIADIEVYSNDWVFVCREVESTNYTVIHNDNYRLREFMDYHSEDIFGFFNGKHYDTWIILTMLLGGSNVEVKRHNDFIIGKKGAAWEFPFIQYKRKPFKSFDLRDDIADQNISLKAIEGNLCLPIVESSVDFDIDRPLTPEELDEVIRYCKNDVDATIQLYKVRNEYISSKQIVGKMYGVDESEAIGLTNAKLAAKVFNAKKVTRNDERDYIIPDCIDQSIIPKKVLDFFLQIHDKSIPDIKLFGDGKSAKGMTFDFWIETSAGRTAVTIAWGGIHGAKFAFQMEADGDTLILNFDVASLYPNSAINFGYCSRSMEDPDAYKKLVNLRLTYKAEAKKFSKKIVSKLGDGWYKPYDSEELSWKDNLSVIAKDVDEDTFNDIKSYVDADNKQAALKLIINTYYGAMLNKHNDLADRLAGRSICITNQLCMIQLIVNLASRCETIDFININTDGIMFAINKREEKIAVDTVSEWEKVTGFVMERDDFKKVIQKDVNNYIGIKSDGKIKTKGGYVSLYKGGNFKTNSLQIIDKSIVEYLVNNIPPETTINNCKDIFAFQQIAKTGGSYEGSYHYVNGKREPIQKVNRIYAVKDPKYGSVVKGKWITEKRKKDKATGKMIVEPVNPPIWQENTIPECPEHTFIDNENVLTVDALDKDYYIDMAKKRIDKYINLDRKVENKLNKIKEVIVIMATAETKTASNAAVAKMNVYAKLIEARKMFLAAKVKKTGVNRYAEFKYFTLEDIIPVKQAIFEDLGLIDVISFTQEVATLTLYNASNPEETLEFKSFLAGDESLIKNPIQKVGAIETYVRRYLYLLMLDIVEADSVDSVSGKPVDEDNKPVPTAAKKNNRPATTEEREATKAELINQSGEATDTQIKAIKNGLKKLRAKDESYETYVTAAVKKIKAGLNKTEAEDLLIEIGGKIEE